MVKLKTGSRLKSSVCDTQIMVVRAPDGKVELSCGGAPMVDVNASTNGGDISPDAKAGAKLGKRYVDPSGDLEILCVKAGAGSLAMAGTTLQLKEAAALPSSD